MRRNLSRLLRPQSIAVIGGGAWCDAVLAQLEQSGFPGDVWHIHPTGNTPYQNLTDLPYPPDAAFIGINRVATINIVSELHAMGAGGAVCFASGFAEVDDGDTLNTALVSAAGDMPILGPNCYGMINALDGVLLWPDQHGCIPVDRGVAILTQSSNIAINLTMQTRGLPISYVVTCGNQAQTTQADIAMGLLDDPRVTAIGLHIEGFGDLAKWQCFARAAKAQNIPIVAVKVGKSDLAQAATVSHTASLAGGDAGAGAMLARLGIARVDDLSTFLETLKIMHVAGPLPCNAIATISCSGGEASLAADLAYGLNIVFPPLNAGQTSNLSTVLGPKVALANPLDYHTYIWRNTDTMTDAFCAMVDPQLAITMLIVDFPRTDRCDATDWDCTVNAAIATREKTGGIIAMVATLPELLPEDVSARLLAHGVIPLHGLRDALCAAAAAQVQPALDLHLDLPILGALPAAPMLMTEAAAKSALSAYGLPIPQQITTNDLNTADTSSLTFPVALKGTGIAHKTEVGAVALNLADIDAVRQAGVKMPTETYLIEEMVSDTIAEILIGVVRDPAHGFTLTIGAGGVLIELLEDSVTLLLPSSPTAINQSLTRLKIYKLLCGYRGGTAADIPKIVSAIMAIQDYVLANADKVAEVEINPLMCGPTTAIAADALIRIAL